jgi:hypothetical protein
MNVLLLVFNAGVQRWHHLIKKVTLFRRKAQLDPIVWLYNVKEMSSGDEPGSRRLKKAINHLLGVEIK